MHLPMYSIRIFDLENDGQRTDNLDEIWPANVACQHAYVFKNLRRTYMLPVYTPFRRNRVHICTINLYNYKMS